MIRVVKIFLRSQIFFFSNKTKIKLKNISKLQGKSNKTLLKIHNNNNNNKLLFDFYQF